VVDSVTKFMDGGMRDPYLHIARIDGFRYYENSEWSKVLIECKTSVQAFVGWIDTAGHSSWITVSELYKTDALCESRFCTAMVRRELPQALNMASISGQFWTYVETVEWADAIRPRQITDEVPVGDETKSIQAFDFPDTVVGIIDVGIPIARRSLGIRNGARQAALWVQSGKIAGGARSADANYGCEISNIPTHPTARAFANALSSVSDASSEEAYYITNHFEHLIRRESHGTAVADIAAGSVDLSDWVSAYHQGTSRVESGADVAATAPLLAVDLPAQVLRYTSRAAMSAHILDGLAWMLNRAGSNARLIANISFGTITGASKGESILERALDDWISTHTGKLGVVLPAGNARESQCHATIPKGASGTYVACLQVLPDDVTPNFIEISIPANVKDVSVSLQSPNGQTSVPAKPGHIVSFANEYHVAFPAPSSRAGLSTTVVIAIGATAHGDAPAGDWIIRVNMASIITDAIDLWVERDESHFFRSAPARQSRFVNPHVSHLSGVAYQVDGGYSKRPQPLSVTIDTDGTLSSIAASKNVIVVGGFVASSGRIAPYSGEGTAKKRVTVYAWSDESPSQRGLRVAATRSGDYTRMSGTSLAAPFVTRDIANQINKVPGNVTLLKAPNAVIPAPIITNERVVF
jgi:hypothetical protein